MEFGLIIIGDELLSGSRSDKHLPRFRDLLGERGFSLGWCWILPDRADVLVDHLRRSLAGDDPVFCCGGIGATPDDLTRECAALAAELPLERHPRAAVEIEAQFGAEAYPNRILMADLPRGCGLIPNPHNRIPGFSLQRHYFLPGFPQMAWPMAEWVLREHYPATADPLRELSLWLYDVPESELIGLMRDFHADHPEHKLFSLPRLGERKAIQMGLRGRGAGLDDAFEDLWRMLKDEGFTPVVGADG